MQELKIKIIDPQPIKERLDSLGATLVDETTFTDTYFNQPAGEVFKVTHNEKGYFLVQLKKTPDNRFMINKDNPIEHADQVIAEMTNEYGVKCVLQGKRSTFSLSEYKVTINLIDERGAFLILTGENPTEEFIVNTLGLEKPEYVTVSFDELPPTTFKTPTE